MAYKDCLSYTEEDNKIRWSGTEPELKNFITTFISVVDGWNDGKWEDDPKHNMLSYKTSKIVLKWYSTTKTILVQGKEHAELKLLLCNLAKEVNNEIPVDIRKEGDEQDGEANSEQRDGEENVMMHRNEEDNGSINSENVQLNDSFQPENELTCKCKCKCSETTRRIDILDNQLEELKGLLHNSSLLSDPNSVAALLSENERLKSEILQLRNENASLLTVLKLINKPDCHPATEPYNSDDQDEVTNINSTTGTINDQTTTSNNKPGSSKNKANTKKTKMTPQPNSRTPAQTEADEQPRKKSVVVLGDSIVKGIHGWRLSRTRNAPLVTVKSFPAATTEDMESYCIPTIRAQPDELILHIGTNDLQTNTSRQVIDNIVNLADNISQNCTSEVTISSLLKRLDKPNLDSKVTEINNGLHKFAANRCWKFISHNNINRKNHFNSNGLHLSHEGNSLFASNLIKHFNSGNTH